MEKDYYRILELEPSASQEEIRLAFKRLALLSHPDRSEDPDATEQMKLLNEAYAVLKDGEKRAQYDLQRLAAQVSPVSVPYAPPAAPPARPPFTPTPPAPRPRPARPPFRADPQKLKSWMRTRLVFLSRILIVMLLLFLWSLFTGEVNLILLLPLLAITLFVIISMVWKIRSFIMESNSTAERPRRR